MNSWQTANHCLLSRRTVMHFQYFTSSETAPTLLATHYTQHKVLKLLYFSLKTFSYVYQLSHSLLGILTEFVQLLQIWTKFINKVSVSQLLSMLTFNQCATKSMTIWQILYLFPLPDQFLLNHTGITTGRGTEQLTGKQPARNCTHFQLLFSGIHVAIHSCIFMS